MTPLKSEALKINRWHGLLEPSVTTQRTKQEPVEVWKCPVCGDTHDSYDEAAECCADETESVAIICPVCAQEHGSFFEAVGCCLWTEFDVAQRISLTTKLEAGATWFEAIEEAGGKTK